MKSRMNARHVSISADRKNILNITQKNKHTKYFPNYQYLLELVCGLIKKELVLWLKLIKQYLNEVIYSSLLTNNLDVILIPLMLIAISQWLQLRGFRVLSLGHNHLLPTCSMLYIATDVANGFVMDVTMKSPLPTKRKGFTIQRRRQT